MPGFIKRSKEVMRRKREEEPAVFVLYFVLRVLVLVTLVRSAFLGHYEHMMLCVLTLVLLLIPSFIEHTLDIDLPDLLESIILLFIFAAEILGEIDAFYIRIPFLDTILHTTWGFLCAGIGFALFDILNRSESSKIHLTDVYKRQNQTRRRPIQRIPPPPTWPRRFWGGGYLAWFASCLTSLRESSIVTSVK